MFKERKLLLILFFFLFLCGCDNNNVIATSYYISPGGNDNANGVSPSTAWKTINKVNSVQFHPGDSILFEAGGKWRDILRISHSGGDNNYIVYSRYGNGHNPQILGSEPVPNWTLTATNNIWKADGSYSSPRSGTPTEIFFLQNDSVSWGNFQDYNSSFSSLSHEYDWTFNNSSIYIYSSSNPNTAYDIVEIPQRNQCIQMPNNTLINYIEINGIDLYFGKSKGFYAGYPALKGATNLTIRNCRIGYIGEKGGSSSYGIVAWHSNFLAENNIITDCGRRGISFNLYLIVSPGDERDISNVVVRNNIFKRGYHTTALDLASMGDADFPRGDKIQNIFFYNNYIDDSDIKMQGEDEPSNQIFFQEGGAYINNVYIFNNIFVNATGRNILIENCDSVYVWNNTIVGHNNNITRSPYSNVSFNYTLQVDYRNNILYENLPDNSIENYGVLMQHTPSEYMARDYNVYYQEVENSNRGFTGGLHGYYNISQWQTYLSRNPTFDQHSPEPANPQFLVLYKDFHLSPNSPAKDAGTAVSHIFTDPDGNAVAIGSFDFDGNPRSPTNPSIGAYEYTTPDLSQACIISFIIPGQKSSEVNNSNHTVDIVMPYGTDLTHLKPTIVTCYAASVDPASGTYRDFSTPVTYTVTSGDNSKHISYTVRVTTGNQPPEPPPVARDTLHLSFAPNPASDQVEVSLIGEAPSDTFYARIFTLPGNIVYKSPVFTGEKKIVLPLYRSLKAGTYIVELIFNNSQSVADKLIISR